MGQARLRLLLGYLAIWLSPRPPQNSHTACSACFDLSLSFKLVLLPLLLFSFFLLVFWSIALLLKVKVVLPGASDSVYFILFEKPVYAGGRDYLISVEYVVFIKIIPLQLHISFFLCTN